MTDPFKRLFAAAFAAAARQPEALPDKPQLSLRAAYESSPFKTVADAMATLPGDGKWFFVMPCAPRSGAVELSRVVIIYGDTRDNNGRVEDNSWTSIGLQKRNSLTIELTAARDGISCTRYDRYIKTSSGYEYETRQYASMEAFVSEGLGDWLGSVASKQTIKNLKLHMESRARQGAISKIKRVIRAAPGGR
jgi:hypothetical protein